MIDKLSPHTPHFTPPDSSGPKIYQGSIDAAATPSSGGNVGTDTRRPSRPPQDPRRGHLSSKDSHAPSPLSSSHLRDTLRTSSRLPTTHNHGNVVSRATEMPSEADDTSTDPRTKLPTQGNSASSASTASDVQDAVTAWIKQLVQVATLERASDEVRRSAVTWRERENQYKRKFPESASINESCSNVRREVETLEAKHTKEYKEAVEKESRMPGRSILLTKLAEQQADHRIELDAVLSRLDNNERRFQLLTEQTRALQQEHRECLLQLRQLQSQDTQRLVEKSDSRDYEQQIATTRVKEAILEVENSLRSEQKSLSERLQSLEKDLTAMKTKPSLYSTEALLEESLKNGMRSMKRGFVSVEAHASVLDELSRLRCDIQLLEAKESRSKSVNGHDVLSTSEFQALKHVVDERFKLSDGRHFTQSDLYDKLKHDLADCSGQVNANTSKVENLQTKVETVITTADALKVQSSKVLESFSSRLEMAEQSRTVAQREADVRLAHLEGMAKREADSIPQLRQRVSTTEHSIQSLSAQYNAITTTTLYKKILALCAPIVVEIEDAQKKLKELTAYIEADKSMKTELTQRIASLQTSLTPASQWTSVLTPLQNRVAQLEALWPDIAMSNELKAKLHDCEKVNREIQSQHRALMTGRDARFNDVARDLASLESRVMDLVKSSAPANMTPGLKAMTRSDFQALQDQYDTLAEKFERSRIALVTDIERLKLNTEGARHVQINNLPSKVSSAEDLESLLHKKVPETRGRILDIRILDTALSHAGGPSKRASPSAIVTLADAHDAADLVDAVCGRIIRGRCWSAKKVIPDTGLEVDSESMSEPRQVSDSTSSEPILDLAEWQLRQPDKSPGPPSTTAIENRRRKPSSDIGPPVQRAKRMRGQS